MNSPVIVSYARTPITKFVGSLSSLSAPQLGSHAIQGAISRIASSKPVVPEAAYIGNVLSAGLGQAPARQAVLGAKLPQSTICTAVNKVCASGMKAVMLSCQSIELGQHKTMLAVGMESMSNVPYYVKESRVGFKLGHHSMVDGVIHDGLWDVYTDQHMGNCAEKCSRDYKISRQEQDAYATESYHRAIRAQQEGLLENEITPIEIPSKKKGQAPKIIDVDEEPKSIQFDKISQLRPAFQRDADGTVTAANSSSLNDGAASLILMNEAHARDEHDITQPLARILSYSDAEQLPVDFTTSPSLAVQKALDTAGMSLGDVDYHEINEAFSVVALANMKILNLDPDKVNVFGGAVSLGHPIGMSGARIIGTLYNVLKQRDATIGCASICNGGGGASAVVIERMK